MARPSLPPVHLLHTLMVAVRLENFTTAALELGVTQSAVSRQMRELEGMLGFTLFRRVGRRVIPTPAARHLAVDVAPDLERLSKTVRRASSAGGKGRVLRVASLPTFADRWLLPRLASFEALHSGVRVDISTRLAPFDLAREAFDVAIHYGSADWPDANVVHLCAERMAPVAAPSFGQSNMPIRGPLLHLVSRPDAWAEWSRLAGRSHEGTGVGRHLDQFSLIITAAVQGMGAALLPLYLIERELADGRLVALSDVVLETEGAYHVVLPSGQSNPLAASFSHWLRSRVGRPIDEEPASTDATTGIVPPA